MQPYTIKSGFTLNVVLVSEIIIFKVFIQTLLIDYNVMGICMFCQVFKQMFQFVYI